ncbi:uncharacterized protein LOC8262724 [Ricinus communis]|uniref:TOD1/MUCI70 glycosyltransferase-like domain-containing protein n=1 Tax=Ricinus communis TaxID=3988 RepID=B9SLF7_RICCO|nr:uncharacterized protein LOC8262724 [Ricinus communis]EEF35560.1 conserved hypothetical protein [Ricinus communis]|eukprot:XP_002526825.1 uncharacterized protein LOC8262724 [Ricinus communis]
MAQYRQSGHHYINGATSSDHVSIGIRASPSASSSYPAAAAASSSQSQYKPIRGRRSARSDKSHCSSSFSIGALIVVLSLVLVVTVLAYYYISADNKEINDHHGDGDDEVKNDLDFLTNVTRTDTVKVLEFGQGSAHGRDSRYWDKDDRRRDGDYNEDDVDHDSKEAEDESTEKGHNLVKMKNGKEKTSQNDPSKGLDQRGTGLYNEDGRKELKMYEAEYEASLKNAGQSRNKNEIKPRALDDEEQNEGVDTDNEYDDGIDSHDPHVEDYGDSDHDNGHQASVRISSDEDGREFSNFNDADTKDQNVAKDNHEVSENISDKSLNIRTLDNVDNNSQVGRSSSGQSTTKSRSYSKKKSRHRKGSCEMKFLNSTTQLVEPFESRKFARFSLQYSEKEEKPNGDLQWEPKFAGHQSLQEWEESFLVHDQKINCGFVKGPEGSPSTGFDLSEDDASYISRCHIAVISCIFGNSDRLRSPPTKMVTRLSRKNVCFVIFVDKITLQTLSSEGHMPDIAGFIGFWKVVVVKNLPYTDMRRVGKIPKMLPHRLFPSARYSIWLDSKLRLQIDPLLVLEYFLWRKGYEYAISNHYDRHCVWEEVAQNKRLNKYNHTIIDQQFTFYQADGLKKFNASDPNKLLPSNVPEGSLIVRAHTPMSNLFSCLWFNEVERFTPRDQLSFAYTYQKLRRMNPDKPFHLHMFKDCERRAVAKLFRHRSEEKRNSLRQQAAE